MQRITRLAAAVFTIGVLTAGLAACGSTPASAHWLARLTTIDAPDHASVGEVFTSAGFLLDAHDKTFRGSQFKEKCTVKTLTKTPGSGPAPATAFCLASATTGNLFYVGYGLVSFPNQVLPMYQGNSRVGTMTLVPSQCGGPADCPVQYGLTVAHL
jgi:hypothetical protein